MRDIVRKTGGKPDIEAASARVLMLAARLHAQNRNLRPVRGQPAGTDLRVFSLHSPDVECADKAHKPSEFGVKVSVATALTRSKGGQFVTDVAALPGKP